MTAADTMKPWQHGISIDYLSELEARFEYYNAFSCSPFSEMTKPKLADALHHSRLHVFDWGIVENDFVTTSTGIKAYLDVTIARKEAGDRVIEAFCCSDPQPMVDYLKTCEEATWVWIWQEDEQQRQIVHDAGYEFVGSKITSFAEIRGLYFREADDALVFVPRQRSKVDPTEFIGVYRTPINVDVTDAVKELNALTIDFTDHYSNYAGTAGVDGKRGKRAWSALSLRGYSSDPGFIEKPSEMNKKWHAEHEGEKFALQDTVLRTQLPAIAAVCEPLLKLSSPHRIRLMRLTPGGGELRRHTDLVDKDSGISDGHVARFHFPLITNPDVLFNSWGMDGVCHEVNMMIGECWYLDTRKPHRAINGGETERTHLVVDVESNDAVRALLL